MSTSTIEPPTRPSQGDTQPPAPAPKAPAKFQPAAVAHMLDKLGLGYFSPIVKLAAGDEPARQTKEILLNTILPLIAFALFLGFWSFTAKHVRTDSMAIPTPSETWEAWLGICAFADAEKEKAREFDIRMEERVVQLEEMLEKAKAEGKTDLIPKIEERIVSTKERGYAGPPTFFTQIGVSLFTVAVGFLAATIIAVPIGILCGLSKLFNIAVNPLIQIFRPVSPLAWLPIVFVFVTALYEPADDALVSRALLVSALTVTLCSLWPTLVNTAVGVASIDPDHLNVARVLKLNWFQQLFTVVLPSALPLMFTGLRLSLGVGWMVLIAADMLAQNPGLGKFVWDTFQNGSTESMAQIVVAVFAIGIIGFALDRIMLVMQRLVTFEDQNI